jgi:hypothetical protein
MLELHFGDSVMIVKKAITLECFVEFPHPPKFHTFQSTSGALHEERWMDSWWEGQTPFAIFWIFLSSRFGRTKICPILL